MARGFASTLKTGFAPGLARGSALVALGAHLSRKGFMAGLSLFVAVATTIGCLVMGFMVARSGRAAPLHLVPLLTASALAWGSGFLLAFSASVRALRRDRSDGIRALVMARTGADGSLGGYLLARIVGLAWLLALVIGGGTLLVGVVTSLLGARFALGARTFQATVASVVFALAFAAVMAPVALAALGSRSRIGGYLFLLLVVVAPSVFAEILARPLGPNVAELLSIPSSLVALRSGLMPGSVDLLRVLRASLSLAFFAGLSTALVRKDAMALEGTIES